MTLNTYPFHEGLVSFPPHNFFNSKHFLGCLLQFWFIEATLYLVVVKVHNFISYRLSVINFFNFENLFSPSRGISFLEDSFVFGYSDSVPHGELGFLMLERTIITVQIPPDFGFVLFLTGFVWSKTNRRVRGVVVVFDKSV